MNLRPIKEIAEMLGMETQELSTLLLRLLPNPCVVRNGELYADLDRVIYTLDRNGITFPNDNRPVADYHPGDAPFLLPRSSHPRLTTTMPAEVLAVSPASPAENDDRVHEVEVESPRRATSPTRTGRTGARQPFARGEGQVHDAEQATPDRGARQDNKRQSRRRR